MKWTKKQEQIISHRQGNLLVSAGAGAGKTAVLVERIGQIVMDSCDQSDIDRFLVVTFTNAAAAGMKDRILKRLLEELDNNPDNTHLKRQVQLIPHCSIMTIHSFCIDVIKKNITWIRGLDPGFRVGDEIEVELLLSDALAEVLEKSYSEGSEAFTALVDSYGGIRQDMKLEELITDTYRFIRSMPQPFQWLKNAVDSYKTDTESQPWKEALFHASMDSIDKAKSIYSEICREYEQEVPSPEREKSLAPVRGILQFLDTLNSSPEDIFSSIQAYKMPRMNYGVYKSQPEKKEAVQDMANKGKDLITTKLPGILKFTAISDEMKEIFNERLYPALLGLYNVIVELDRIFMEMKQQRNIIDFSDIEHYALSILEGKEGQVSDAASALKEKYKYIFVDEYQDSNDIQEKIINSVARAVPGNIFMVGDVKQSIYKFRNARPEIFLEKYYSYDTDGDRMKVELQDNYRSSEPIINGINFIFQSLMSKRAGEMDYGKRECLNPSKPNHNPHTLPLPEVNVLYDTQKQLQSQELAEREGDFVAERILELVNNASLWDEKSNALRKVEFRDIVILMRSLKQDSEVFTKALEKKGIPCYGESGPGFYETREIRLMLNLLRVIDNPKQDIPLMGVLTSSIYMFTPRNMAEIRLHNKQDDLFESLLQYSLDGENKKLAKKIIGFLQMLNKWRKEAVYLSIHDLLWDIYIQTDYYNYAAGMPQGDVRRANLDMLLEKSIVYEKGSYQGLFNFLRFIDKMKQKKQDYEEAKILGEGENLVRIMSIHKSKGLEFRIVFLVRLDKQFNKLDMNKPVLLHREFGIGAELIDSDKHMRFNTPMREGIRKKKKAEMIAEEMRILYVGLTRAMDRLYLVGSKKGEPSATPEKKDESFKLPPYESLDGSSYLDWIVSIISRKAGNCWNFKRWDIAGGPVQEKDQPEKIIVAEEINNEEDILTQLNSSFSWQYSEKWRNKMRIRLSVSEIKKEAKLLTGEDEFEAVPDMFPQERVPHIPSFIREDETTISGAYAGTLFHEAISRMDFTMLSSKAKIMKQLKELESKGILPEASNVSLEQLYRFGNSQLCKRMIQGEILRKEEPFILTLTVKELQNMAPQLLPSDMEPRGLSLDNLNENIMIQGIIDCFFVEEKDIVLVDFKTDRMLDDKRRASYQAQLELYALALERIHRKKVKEKLLYMVRHGTVIEF